MDQHDPIKPVAATVATFRSINQDGKSEEEYQAIFKQVIRQLHDRVTTYEERIMDAPICRGPKSSVEGKEVEERLGLTILPALKEKIKDWPAIINPSNVKNNPRSWFERALDQLVGIDQLVEDIESCVLTIWADWEPELRDPSLRNRFIEFRGEQITLQTNHLLNGAFRGLLKACDAFFVGSKVSTLSCNDSDPIYEMWGVIGRLSTLTIEKTDTLIQWLLKSMLSAAKEKWRELVDDIDDCLRSLDRYLQFYYGPRQDDKSESKEPRRDNVTMCIPIIKICRIFFNKLVRVTNSQPSIFAQPSMEMKCNQLKQLLIATYETQEYIECYVAQTRNLFCRRRDLVNQIINLQGGLLDCYHTLDRYWDSLLARNDPEVDQKLIADNKLWLESWTSAFFRSFGNAIEATGSQFPSPDSDTESDIDDDGFMFFSRPFDYDDDEDVDDDDDDDEDDEDEDDDDDDDDEENREEEDDADNE
ncbi:hypothetical protein PCANC_15701 [Puccinia coronata f. sp. avenae]|uniref:Uncharacterized protein n=1 Tax=Puccinia coronata f. sp. avenae TaxID=200324 RepID=A0A2N5SNE6_9BASI|nr:hypothetical protein PCANC_15701 [Puccinia coronata f. sp. avenae]